MELFDTELLYPSWGNCQESFWFLPVSNRRRHRLLAVNHCLFFPPQGTGYLTLVASAKYPHTYNPKKERDCCKTVPFFILS